LKCPLPSFHPRNIPAKFGSNWPSGFGEEALNVKSLQTTDDGRQMMAIVPMDLMIIEMSFTKFLFFMPIGNPR
jgi:hypothetical protein